MPEDLPLALRRPRRSTGACPAAAHETLAHLKPVEVHPPQTPSRGNKKRVRFSDPGLTTEAGAGDQDEDEDTSTRTSTSTSTGLTPFMRRTTLTPPSSSGGSKRRRRHSGPAAAALTHHDVFTPDRDTGYSGQVTFLPLRQVLDGRVKRRIRRNGLSEEMNVISAEKRHKSQQAKAQVDALRAELAAKDAEIRRLSGVTAVVDHDDEESIDHLRREAEQLRRGLKSPAPSHATEEDYDTSGSTRVGDQDSGECLHMDVDFDDDDETSIDHFFGEESIAEIACSTPSRRQSDARRSFPTPPSSTSPLMRLATPLFRKMVSPTSHAGVQVDLADSEREEMEEELASLHLEIEKLTSTLETYEAMTSRLSDKLSQYAPEGGSAADAILGSRSPTVKVEAQLNKLLQAFSQRTAALSRVDASLGQLGFAGDDAPEMVASLATALRSARLELEYLEPGECALPLTAAGAAVLDLLLARLREASRRSREGDETLEAYAELEDRLRRQLAARVDAMDEMRREAATLRGKVKLRNARIAELETGMDRLRATVKTYTRDIAELEALAQRLEGDLDAARRERRGERAAEAEAEAWSEALAERDEAVARLEGELGEAAARAAELREALAAAEREGEEMRARHREELDAEKGRARAVYEAMRGEMETAVRLGERLMASTPPKSPGRE